MLLVEALLVDVGLLALGLAAEIVLGYGGRSYGRSRSAPISSTRPSKPSVRSSSSAFAPARLAPTMMNVCSLTVSSFR